MKPNLILLPQLLPVICKVSDSSYLSKTMAECSDALKVWWDGNCPQNVPVK